jgi:hypothetical protein
LARCNYVAITPPVSFVLPAHRRKVRWEVVFDTKEEKIRRRQRLIRGGNPYPLDARSMVLLRLPHHETRDTQEQEMEPAEPRTGTEQFAGIR